MKLNRILAGVSMAVGMVVTTLANASPPLNPYGPSASDYIAGARRSMASTFGKNSDALIFAVQPLNDGYIVFTRKSCPEPHDASGKSQDGGAEAIYFKYGGEIKQAGCWVPYADAAALKWADTDGTVTPMRAVQWANVFLSPDGKQYLLKKYGDKFRAMVQHENANRAW